MQPIGCLKVACPHIHLTWHCCCCYCRCCLTCKALVASHIGREDHEATLHVVLLDASMASWQEAKCSLVAILGCVLQCMCDSHGIVNGQWYGPRQGRSSGTFSILRSFSIVQFGKKTLFIITNHAKPRCLSRFRSQARTSASEIQGKAISCKSLLRLTRPL